MPGPSPKGALDDASEASARHRRHLGSAGLVIRLTGQEEPPLFAHVLPMNGSELRTRPNPEAVAALFIGPSMTAALNMTLAETRDYLPRRFGLTSAEADVALEILKGDGRDASAARLGISVTTVRAHLSHIFEKTGVRRQAELVRLLLEGERRTVSAEG